MNTYNKTMMTMRLMLLSSVIVILAACIPEASTVNVTSPTEGQVIVNDEVDITMTYAAGATPTVTLNGRNLGAVVDFQDASASASSSDFSYALKQGSNRLVVKLAGQADLVRNFTFDNAGPKVVFNEIVRNGSNLDLEGEVTDASDIESLSINDLNIAVNANGEFSTTIPQADAYGVLAEDENGIKSYDRYLAAGANLDPMIRSSVDETLIDDISPLIAAAMIVPKDEALFDLINPLRELNILGNTIAINLKKFQGQVDADGNLLDTSTAMVNSLVVSPDSSSGTVTADISLGSVIIGVEVMINDTPLGLNIYADKLDIKGANIRLATDENENLIVEFTEQLPLDLLNTRIEIVDSGPFIGFVLGNPVTNLIVAFVTDNIEGLLGNVLPGLINGELAGRLENLFAGLNIDNDDLRFKLGIASFGKDGTKILADLTAQYESKNPKTDAYALGVKTYSSIDQETGEVSFGGELPVPNDFGQLNATVSFDFINQAMLLALEEGLLDLNLVGSQVVIGAENIDESVVPNGTLWIQVKPSVPELQLIGGETQANVDVKLDNFEINVRTRNDSGWGNLMNLKVGVNIFAGFGFDPANNAIFLETLAQAPVVEVMEVKTFGIGIPPGLANGVVNLTVPAIADLLLNIFKINLPIPADLPLQIKNISTVGEGNQHLSISFDIDLVGIAALLFPPESMVDETPAVEETP